MAGVSTTMELETVRSGVAAHGPTYARLTVAGLLVVASGSLLSMVPEPFIGPIATALSLIVAGVVWRFGRWTYLLAAVYAFPALVVGVALVAVAFVYPDTFLQFVPTLLVLAVGAAITFVAGIRAFRGYRRGDSAQAGPRAGGWLRLAAVAVVGLSVASGVLTFTERSTVAADAAAAVSEIVIKDLKFQPGTIEVRVGETVQLLVRNDDWGLHTFAIEGLDVDHAMRPRSSRRIEFTPTEAGEHRYFCRVLGHGSMNGTLIVR